MTSSLKNKSSCVIKVTCSKWHQKRWILLTCHQSRLYLLQRRSFRSWKTTTPTAPSWVLTCNAKRFRWCVHQRRSWALAWKPLWHVTLVLPSRRAVLAWLTKWMPSALLFAPRKKLIQPSLALIFTHWPSSNVPTNPLASTSARWFAPVTGLALATLSLTAHQLSWVIWPWGKTASWPSCHGRVTTSKTRSCCLSAS